MATDIRGHSVPADTDPPARQDLLDLALSINDPVTVADTTARASVSASVGPTSSRPLYVWRADAGAGKELEVTSDGTNWRTIIASSVPSGTTPLSLAAPWSGTAYTFKRSGFAGLTLDGVTRTTSVSTSTRTTDTILTLSTDLRPAANWYQNVAWLTFDASTRRLFPVWITTGGAVTLIIDATSGNLAGGTSVYGSLIWPL